MEGGGVSTRDGGGGVWAGVEGEESGRGQGGQDRCDGSLKRRKAFGHIVPLHRCRVDTVSLNTDLFWTLIIPTGPQLTCDLMTCDLMACDLMTEIYDIFNIIDTVRKLCEYES